MPATRSCLALLATALLTACQSPGSTSSADVDDADTSASDIQSETRSETDTSCADQCLPEGLAVCDGAQAKRCVRGEGGCLAFETTDCGAAGCTNGVCGGACSDECNAGELVCVGNGVAQCGQADADSCRELLPAVACAQGTTCSNGVCGAQCQNECAQSGTSTCLGAASFRTCGQFDADNCLDLGGTQNCPSGTRCEGGTCVNDCTDECGVGARECSGAGYRTCGQFDADNCREWSTVTACAAGSECDAGQCVELCPGSCIEGNSSCGNQGFRVCMAEDEGSCPELSLNVPCSAGNTCSNGKCQGACTVPRISFAVDVSSSTVGAINDAIRFGVADFASKARFFTQMRFSSFPPNSGGCPSGPYPVLDAASFSVLGTDMFWVADYLRATQGSSTPIAAALATHIDFGDPRQGDAVVLITDGGETCGEAEDVANAVRALRRRGVTVYALGLGAYDDTLLDRVVALGGGRLFPVTTPAEVTSALETIASELGATCPRGVFPAFGSCTAQGTCGTVCAEGTRPCAFGSGCCFDQIEACATIAPTDLTVTRGNTAQLIGEFYEPGVTGTGGTHDLEVRVTVFDSDGDWVTEQPALFSESVTNPFGDVSNDRFRYQLNTTGWSPGTYTYFFFGWDPRFGNNFNSTLFVYCATDWSLSPPNGTGSPPPPQLRGRLIITQ